ncbi:DUF234 domain-containing protein [Sulfurospirillum sp. 1612]|uniref:DUF234 domain-containing protein n=1 Tax=Sulfurospirillum sp. 1612 TaxID=3094835 RepID=UPI002F92C1A1
MNSLNLSKGLPTLVQEHILDQKEALQPYFHYTEDHDKQRLLEKILIRIARGDRKSYTVYNKEKLSQTKGRILYKYLFENHIIKKEKSRELPIKTSKKQLIKKDLRHYQIQDKIQFSNNFTRFWFTFIAKNFDKEQISYDQDIEPFLDKYISLEFENLSNTLLCHIYKKDGILSSGSYWDKNLEIDLFIKTQKENIAGEVKWKNSKVCKNILNALIHKCKKSNLDVNKFALFSKSGYSKELETKKYANIELYYLDDFKRLLDD